MQHNADNGPRCRRLTTSEDCVCSDARHSQPHQRPFTHITEAAAEVLTAAMTNSTHNFVLRDDDEAADYRLLVLIKRTLTELTNDKYISTSERERNAMNRIMNR